MSVLSQWSSRVFSVELDGADSYFAIQETRKGGVTPEAFKRAHRDRCYSVLVSCSHRLRQVKFHADLKEKLLRALPPGCDVAPMASFLPGVRDSLIRGYFLKDRSEDPSSSDRLLRDLARHDPVLVCSYVRCEDGTWTQNLWPDAHSEKMKTFYLVQSEAPEVHPSTLNIINTDVFYSFEEAREVLKEVKNIQILMFTCIYDKLYPRVAQGSTAEHAKWPFIFSFTRCIRWLSGLGVCVCSFASRDSILHAL